MPARSYSKRSRQPSGNAARCNDPSAPPKPALLAATTITHVLGNEWEIEFERPYRYIPNAPDANPHLCNLMVRRAGVWDFERAATLVVSETKLRIEIQGDALVSGDEWLFAEDFAYPRAVQPIVWEDGGARFNALDNGTMETMLVILA